MKKLILCLTLAMIQFCAFAQTTATATRTVHKAGGKDKVVSGTLYAKSPSKVAIVNGKDALIMNGTAFTMKKGPLKAKTDAQKDARYKTFHDVLNNILLDGKYAIGSDAKVTKSGSNTVYTITPDAAGKKLMFSSYVITVSGGQLKSIRLNQKGGAYTEYTFSAYKSGQTINDSVFK